MADVNKADLVKIIVNNCPTVSIEESQYEESLGDLGVDSLDFSAIFLEIEEKYNVKIPDEDIANLVSIDAIADYLKK